MRNTLSESTGMETAISTVLLCGVIQTNTSSKSSTVSRSLLNWTGTRYFTMKEPYSTWVVELENLGSLSNFDLLEDAIWTF